VAPVALPPNQAEPIFILGSVRSGTSVLVNALRQGAGINGYDECNVAALMERLTDVVREFYGNLSPAYLAAKDRHLIAALDPAAIETWIVNYFAAFLDVRMGRGQWVAKSPDSYLTAPMIRSSRRLATMFPKAKFIFCARRGIENVMSRVKKWPEIPFGYHCQSWAHTFEEWFKVRPALKGRELEVRQSDVALRPETVADDLKRFLGLSQEQRDGILRVFQGPRTEQLQLAQEHREIGLDETPWSGDHRAEFLDWCRPMMEAAGYGLRGRVGTAKTPLRVFYPKVPGAVELNNVNPEWGFVEIDDSTFQIHPNGPGGPPAEVRWPAIPLSGESRFAVELRLNHPDAPPVKFGLRVEKTGTREAVIAEEIELSERGSWERGEIAFSPLDGPHDVVLSTRVGEGAHSATYAWAQFRDAQLR
jgi:Sulfotransferase family